MENNLYYTPVISEFHVEFEYEVLDPDTKEYYKWVISDKYELQEAFDEYPLVRVKFLDREDVEGLGWKYVPDLSEGDGNMRWYDLFKLNEFTITLGLIEGSEIIRKGKNTIFEGVIKNKSELKKLMKQLNIL